MPILWASVSKSVLIDGASNIFLHSLASLGSAGRGVLRGNSDISLISSTINFIMCSWRLPSGYSAGKSTATVNNSCKRGETVMTAQWVSKPWVETVVGAT